MNEPDYDYRDDAEDNRRADEDADYPRRQVRWAGCGERPGCGADDCPTCRPGTYWQTDDEEEPATAEESEPTISPTEQLPSDPLETVGRGASEGASAAPPAHLPAGPQLNAATANPDARLLLDGSNGGDNFASNNAGG